MSQPLTFTQMKTPPEVHWRCITLALYELSKNNYTLVGWLRPQSPKRSPTPPQLTEGTDRVALTGRWLPEPHRVLRFP